MSSPSAGRGPAPKARRRDIEGLRAVAALLVAAYHLWLGRVSGGVDVFFAVSGFLITTTLLGQWRDYGRFRAGLFFGNLARRLLPAALTVLIAVVLVRALILPPFLDGPEIVASALYFENWFLAFSAIDYLAADDPHSAVQHFWAMSIQGQFYVIWFVVFAALARRTGEGSFRRVALVALGVLFAVSLVVSVVLTAADQAFTYFNTAARVWEFALGGVIALVIGRLRIPRVVRIVLGWVGLAMVVSCGLIFDVSTVFPGFAALWPTVGAAFVLIAGAPGEQSGPNPVLAWRPVAWLGGLSYGIYLWHWPLLIFAREVLGRHDVGFRTGLAIIAASIVLSWLTRLLVERPLQRLREARGRVVATAGPVLVALAVVFSSLTATAVTERQDEEGRELLAAAAAPLTSTDPRPCLGAAALDPTCEPLPESFDRVIPLNARADLPAIFRDGCRTSGDEVARLCHYGDPDGEVSILLYGNSHAASWFPAFRLLAERNGWRLDVFFRSGCVFNAYAKRVDAPKVSCVEFYEQVQAQLAELPPYDYVFSTYRTKGVNWFDANHEPDPERAMEGFRLAWEPLVARGSTILVIRDVPQAGPSQLSCRDRSRKYGADQCLRKRSDSEGNDLMFRAAIDHPNAIALDMNDWFCTVETCAATVGRVKVQQDTSSHITASYMLTVAPYLERELLRIFAERAEGSGADAAGAEG